MLEVADAEELATASRQEEARSLEEFQDLAAVFGAAAFAYRIDPKDTTLIWLYGVR